jgi:branched-subunit amino acid aminotransferase/4-amino-4-deoxychorismate lyase
MITSWNFTINAPLPTITPQNRAVCYGDTLFETMLWENGKIYFLDDHLERLYAGMKFFSMRTPCFLQYDGEITQHVTQMAKLLLEQFLESTVVRVRLTVIRKEGGLYTPTRNEVDVLITVIPHQPAATTIKYAYIAQKAKVTATEWSQFKTGNALCYVLAGLEKKERQAPELILLNQDGYVAECSASNIFWKKDNVLFTPSLQSGCIAGVRRKQIIKNATLPVIEGLFLPIHLKNADEIFTTNAAGITYIQKIIT